MPQDIELPKDAPGTPPSIPAKTGPNAGLMTQKEFADKMRDALRDTLPSIDDASDIYIVNHAFKRRPELMQKVVNPTIGDVPAAREQQRMLDQKEENAKWLRASQALLPIAGGLGGDFLGAAGGGVGAIPGGMAGAGFGRWLGDYIGEASGVDPETSTGSKAARAGLDAGLYGATSGILQSAPGIRAVGNQLMSRFPWIGKTLGPFINIGSSLSKVVPEGAEQATAGSVIRDTAEPITNAITGAVPEPPIVKPPSSTPTNMTPAPMPPVQPVPPPAPPVARPPSSTPSSMTPAPMPPPVAPPVAAPPPEPNATIFGNSGTSMEPAPMPPVVQPKPPTPKAPKSKAAAQAVVRTDKQLDLIRKLTETLDYVLKNPFPPVD
jgi:hypothetical protein